MIFILGVLLNMKIDEGQTDFQKTLKLIDNFPVEDLLKELDFEVGCFVGDLTTEVANLKKHLEIHHPDFQIEKIKSIQKKLSKLDKVMLFIRVWRISQQIKNDKLKY